MARDLDPFIRQLAGYIENLNLTEGAFAKRAGVDRATVARWLGGQGRPDRAAVVRFQEILDLTDEQLDDLLDLAGYDTRPAAPAGVGERVDTGRGAHVGGDISVEYGDFVGRDQVIYGDLIMGNKIVYQAPRPPIPLQRPPRAEHFTDREADLARLLADLQPGRVVTLCGPGGIGKTALAAEAVWRLAPGSEPPERFPDGLLFYSFYGRHDPALALEHIALSLGEEPRPTPAAAAFRALAGKQALLVLDGAEEADDLGIVLEQRGGCGVLITSRSRKDAPAGRLDVAPLPAGGAAALLQAWGGDYAADAGVVQEICALVGRLPLAVRLAGRYLAETEEDAAGYLEWLRETPLDALDQGRRRQESVRVLLDRSLAQVSEVARQALAAVGLLAFASFGRPPVAAALDIPGGELRRPLDELVQYGLLRREEERYVASHALVHTYARTCCALEKGALGRLAACYDTLVREQRERGVAGYRCLDDERPHVMRVLHTCVEGGLWAAVCSLVWAVQGYLNLCGYWTERVQALVAGVRAARELGHRPDEGAFLGNLGLACADIGQVEEAIVHYHQALAIAREIGDRRGEGGDLGNLGSAYHRLGQIGEAIEFYWQALAIAHEIGDRRNEGNWLGNLGLAYADLGRIGEAIPCYEQALAIARELDDRQGEGNALGNLGNASYRLGQVEQAVQYYRQGLAVAREIGDRRNEENWLGNLGLAYAALGRAAEAIDSYQQSRTIAHQIGDRRAEGNALGNLGNAYADLGQVDRAVECLEQALVIARQIGDRRGEGNHLGNLALAYAELGQLDMAIEYLEQALVIAGETGDRQGEANHLGNLGNAYRDLGQAAKAIGYLEGALAVAREIGDRQGEGIHAWNLGLILEESDPARAVELMSICVAFEREIGHPDAEADAQRVAQIEARMKN